VASNLLEEALPPGDNNILTFIHNLLTDSNKAQKTRFYWAFFKFPQPAHPQTFPGGARESPCLKHGHPDAKTSEHEDGRAHLDGSASQGLQPEFWA
jgi:hypothetical protein